MSVQCHIQRLGYSWGPPINGTLSELDWVPDSSNPKRLTSSTPGPERLSTLGWIWLCDLQIDVSPVQLHFQQLWDEQRSQNVVPVELSVRIVWHTLRLLIHKRYHHLAQMIWDHEGYLCLQRETGTMSDNAEEPGVEQVDVPRSIEQLIHPDTHQFVFQHPLIQDEQHFLKLMKRKKSIEESTRANRNWLLQAIMRGTLTCGRQLNSGLAFPSLQSFNSFNTNDGKLNITPGGSQVAPGECFCPPCRRQSPRHSKSKIQLHSCVRVQLGIHPSSLCSKFAV